MYKNRNAKMEMDRQLENDIVTIHCENGWRQAQDDVCAQTENAKMDRQLENYRDHTL